MELLGKRWEMGSEKGEAEEKMNRSIRCRILGIGVGCPIVSVV